MTSKACPDRVLLRLLVSVDVRACGAAFLEAGQPAFLEAGQPAFLEAGQPALVSRDAAQHRA
jgi:hypothetical protein